MCCVFMPRRRVLRMNVNLKLHKGDHPIKVM